MGAGWAATQYLGDQALAEISSGGRAHIGTLTTLLSRELTVADNAVMSMAGYPWIAPALVSGAAGDIERASLVLDRYKDAMGALVCYILDDRGRTVASSNRNASDSFVGKDYGFRPYFKDAMNGWVGRYFALGITSGERGYYSSFPVWDEKNKVIGVAVIKKNIDRIEDDFKRLDYSFFIDPNGVVFLSGRPDMLFKSLWPLKKETARELSDSLQFGPGPFDPVFPVEYADGARVSLYGRSFILHRQGVGQDGWSLVLLSPTDQIWLYRLFCIYIALILCVLTVVYFAALQSIRESTARIKTSERRYHSLVEGSPNSIYLFDLEGRFVSVNRSGLNTMNWTRAAVIGKRFGEVWPEQASTMVEEAVRQVLGGTRYSFEGECYRPDGTRVTLSVTLYPIYDEAGAFSNFVGIATDITERKKAGDALRESEAKFRTLFDSANDAIIIMDNTVFIDCNPRTLQMFNCSRDEITGRHLWAFSPDVQPGGEPSKEKAQELVSAALDGESKYFQWRHRRIDGTTFDAETSLNRIRLNDKYFLQAIIRDVTERNRREEQLRIHAAALQSAANAVVITNTDGRIIWTNPAFTHLTGYKEEEALEMDMSMLKSGKQEPVYYQNLWETILSGKVWHGEIENLRKDGSLYIEEQTITPVRDAEGKITHFVAIKQDVTKRKQQEQQLCYLATHDSLTGLPNRRLLEDAMKRVVARSRRGAENSLLFMDLDNFKLVNDTLGHAAGDQVLYTLTRILQKHLRTGDLLVRFGGDEFAVLLEGIGRDEAVAVAERMRREVEEYRFVVGDQNFHLSLSIGLVVVDGASQPGLVLSQADTAMYMAKEQGRNRVVVYRPEDGVVARLTEANQWVARIKSALAENRFILHYQPLVRVDNDKVDHYEALIRMRDEDGEIVPPGTFIPVAERYGLMSQVDRWVFDQALKKLEKHPSICIFINISGCSIADEALLLHIEKSLKERGVDPGRLGFEITETAVVQDLVAAERWVRRLKILGCRFALDDFGSGFNSFIYLHNLPVDQIKIDGYYIRALENDPTRCALVQAMHALAQTLGMETVAEFVENDAIMQIIKKIGITYGQGYHIDKPGPTLPDG
ncbi:MAG: bifunctional diguanylate cyclase/phosphodiesterase [Bacillota bacterium]